MSPCPSGILPSPPGTLTAPVADRSSTTLPATSPKHLHAAAELRSASLTLVTLVLKTADPAELDAFLSKKAPAGLFEEEAVLLDISALDPHQFDLLGLNVTHLRQTLRDHGLVLTAVKAESEAQRHWARSQGVPLVADAYHHEHAKSVPEAPVAAAPTPAPAPAMAPEAAAHPTARPAMVVDRPLRSGQQVYARGSDLVVLAAVNFGAEVIADGHIHVYAPLRGRAIAGAKGDTSARIFATAMEPQLIAIAGTYRTLDTDLPPTVKGLPAQVRLDGERLVVEPLTTA